MIKKIRKPIPTSMITAIVLFGLSMLLFYYEQHLSAVLMLIIVGIIVTIDSILIPCSTLFLRGKIRKKEWDRYKSFAKFYLNDRRLSYSKNTFEAAIEYNWLDVVTMCILLGIKKSYSKKERHDILIKAFENENDKIYELLLNGGFSGDFIVQTTKEHFLFRTLEKDKTIYLKCLLEKEISADIENREGLTPLFVAINKNLLHHIKILLEYGSSLKTVNNEGLTPLFYSLAEGKIDICELILEKMDRKKKNHQITFKTLEKPLMIESDSEKIEAEESFIELIASKDVKTLQIVKEYFKNREDYFLQIHTGCELYARISTLEAAAEKQKQVQKSAQFMYSEEECKQDLHDYFMKKYKFSRIGDFKINNIYKEPKYIDSHKEKCVTCNGTGEVVCHECNGTGKTDCPECNGTGMQICKKCNGTKQVSCMDIKKYIECKTCKDGEFECIKCDSKGMQDCPDCQGHGTVKCTCPSDKKTKCPYCDKGYVQVKNGMYKKCPHCNGGEICLLCHNTGWVLEKYIEKGYTCKRCKGKKKIKCTVCRGTKKVKCAKQYNEPCDCKDGYEICEKCGGTKYVFCQHCQGSKKEKCSDCEGGYIYTNVSIDFKAQQVLGKEKIVSIENKEILLDDLLPTIPDKVIANHPFITEVYTIKKANIGLKDIKILNQSMEAQIKQLVIEAQTKGIIDILELIPIYYTILVFKHKDGKVERCILINETFYKSIT